ncbi:acyltransferase family protein [Sphingomonas azotifigens]|uniref:acyltransferase family protein n=1 Tax=Sphingomonas azotifigens TaxID=330920 RepID=UPI001C3FC811|nr:acyltransferase [Sphingomonas azotifigens]
MPYLYGIDAVRLSAAISVALFHLTWQQTSIAATAWFGWIGVQIFFVISGLVIANSSHGATPAKFIKSRFLRIYPTAWICAAISFAVLSTTTHVGLRALLGSLMLSPAGPFLATAYWTLPIELSFYCAVLLLLCIGWGEQLARFAAALALLSSVYTVAFGLHCFGYVHAPWLDFAFGWKNVTLLRHGIYFALGIFLWRWSVGRATRLDGMMGALCIAAATLEISCGTLGIARISPAGLSFARVWLIPLGYAALGLLAIIAAIGLRARIAVLPRWTRTALRLAGLVTYPLYLLHEAVGLTAVARLAALGVSPLASALLALGLTGLLALAVAAWMEPIVQGWIRNALPDFRRRRASLSR